MVRSGPIGKVLDLEGTLGTQFEAELLARRTAQRRGLWAVVLQGEWQARGEPPNVWAFARRRIVCHYTPQGVRQ